VSSRIGTGPWARALGTVLVPDDSTREAIRGEELWRQGTVEDLRIETGQITARVDGFSVTITAPTIPPRIWDAMVRYARGRGSLEQAVRGDVQSVQLEHLLAQDWDEPLIPAAESFVAACSADTDDPACPHIAALAYAVTSEIDARPSIFLRWRLPGAVDGGTPRAMPGDSSAWAGAVFPAVLPENSRQTEAVLRRLGASGIRVGDVDLADVLAPAYSTLLAVASSPRVSTAS
jgi:hypothetical protein